MAPPPVKKLNISALQQFEQLLKRATDKKASDVHLKAGLPPVVRVDGQLYYLSFDGSETVNRLQPDQIHEIAYSLLKEKQKDRYALGEEIDLGHELAGIGRFRINICQQRGLPRLVCRYIPDQIRTIKELGLPSTIETLCGTPRGLILVTGATGSGKSTTLASMIDHITRTRSCHIVTIEDPIEFVFKDRKSIVTQREIGLDTRGFSFALKYALRQDPDVILVGEMRDEETILMALSAAETGHLVLSTLHTSNATETINRILSSISSGYQAQVRSQIASCLVGVVSQRLLRRKEGRGRIAAVEILLANARVRELILEPERTSDLSKVIDESQTLGMQTFDQSLLDLYRTGEISVEEAIQACSNPRDFQMRLDGIVAGDWKLREETSGVIYTGSQEGSSYQNELLLELENKIKKAK